MAIIKKNLTGIFTKKRTVEDAKILVTGARTTLDEDYNRLKDNVLYLGVSGKKVLQIESTISGEGKTSVVCNLAVSLSHNDKKVLVVDLDFRAPGVSKVFGVKEENGLGDCVLGELSLDTAIKSTSYGVDVITMGREIYNSSYVLNSQKTKEIIEKLKEKYDFILLDCPPVLLHSDYMHIANFSDGILYVVAAGFVKKTAVRESLSLMEKLSCPVLGAVMTCVADKN